MPEADSGRRRRTTDYRRLRAPATYTRGAITRRPYTVCITGSGASAPCGAITGTSAGGLRGRRPPHSRHLPVAGSRHALGTRCGLRARRLTYMTLHTVRFGRFVSSKPLRLLSASAPSESSSGAAFMDAEVANCCASKHGPGQSVKFLAAREHIDNQLYALDLRL